MNDNFTQNINSSNVNHVREQIAKKSGFLPYLATKKEASNILTDYDVFPYPRYFRGVPTSSVPIVAEREAGWRPRHDDCYKVLQPPSEPSYPNHCYQAPCSTTYPCYPEYLAKYADRELLNTILNKACTVQYR